MERRVSSLVSLKIYKLKLPFLSFFVDFCFNFSHYILKHIKNALFTLFSLVFFLLNLIEQFSDFIGNLFLHSLIHFFPFLLFILNILTKFGDVVLEFEQGKIPPNTK